MFTPTGKRPHVKLAIIRSSSIGDVVLATACIDLLKKLDINFSLTWFGREPSLTLIAKAFPEITCLDVKRDQTIIQKKLSESHSDYHAVIDLQTNLRSRTFAHRLGRRLNIPVFSSNKNSLERAQLVFQARLRTRSKTPSFFGKKLKTRQFELMLDTLKDALNVLLPLEQQDKLQQTIATPSFVLSEDKGKYPWQQELKFGSWLAVAPGAAHPTKRAPLAVTLDILTCLRQRLADAGKSEKDIGIVFLGSEQDRRAASDLIDQLGWRGSSLNLSGKLSLWESALAVSQTQMILSNDSSLAHIAEATGVPAAVLFGPTVEAFGFSPWRKESQSFSVGLGCRPCSKHGKAPCRYDDQLCFRLIDSDKVAAHIFQRFEDAASARDMSVKPSSNNKLSQPAPNDDLRP